MSCASGFEYILRMGETPEKVAQELLKQVEEKEECKDKNKYEMALTIVRNDLQRKIQEGTDANTRNRLKAVSDKILLQQDNEKVIQKKQDNLEYARKYIQEQPLRSSVASDTSSTQPQTDMLPKSPEEIQEERERNLAEYEAARKAQEQKKKKRFYFFGGNKTKKSKKGMSLCAKKTAKKCEKVRGCKVASGTKRTYCRKKKNHSKKSHKK